MLSQDYAAVTTLIYMHKDMVLEDVSPLPTQYMSYTAPLFQDVMGVSQSQSGDTLQLGSLTSHPLWEKVLREFILEENAYIILP